MVRIVTAAATAVLAAGLSLVSTLPASAAPLTPVCTWKVTASGLFIHSAPNNNMGSRIGETFKGDTASAHLPLTVTKGFLFATSNGSTGYMDESFLASEGCS